MRVGLHLRDGLEECVVALDGVSGTLPPSNGANRVSRSTRYAKQ